MALDSLHTTTGTPELQLQLPPAVEYLRTVRLVAADAAERAGFDWDETEDLRIAVDELTHAVMQATDEALLVRFDVDPGCVKVRGSAHRGRGQRACSLSRVAESIVSAVSDTFELLDHAGELCFTLEKHGGGAIREP